MLNLLHRRCFLSQQYPKSNNFLYGNLGQQLCLQPSQERFCFQQPQKHRQVQEDQLLSKRKDLHQYTQDVLFSQVFKVVDCGLYRFLQGQKQLYYELMYWLQISYEFIRSFISSNIYAIISLFDKIFIDFSKYFKQFVNFPYVILIFDIQRLSQQYLRMNKQKTRKKINNYIIHLDEPLGQGVYAKVFVAHDEKTQTSYAVKIVERAKMQADEYTAKAIKLEISIHHSLVHPNIVRIYEIVQTPNNYYMFMEYCAGGSLRKLLNSQSNRRLSEGDALHCLRCICAGFQPMFEKGVIHRDLKPQNIVIQGDQLKITDFGFAKALTSGRQLTRTVIGTPLYMSPQILAKQPYNSKCDIWSVGVIFYELLFGTHPWTAQGLSSLLAKIKNNKEVKFPAGTQISQLSKSLLIQCLQFQENERISWIQLYEHEIWGPAFQDIAKGWRSQYIRAEQRLSSLRGKLQVQLLVGVFLRVRAPFLNYFQFYAIMKSLLGEDLEQKEVGMMYEVFDKDSNGVIDLLQFAGSLCNQSQQVLQLISTLVSEEHYYQQLSNWPTFSQLSSRYDESVRNEAFSIISNMKF